VIRVTAVVILNEWWNGDGKGERTQLAIYT